MDCWVKDCEQSPKHIIQIDGADMPLCPGHAEDVERLKRRHEGAVKVQQKPDPWADYGAALTRRERQALSLCWRYPDTRHHDLAAMLGVTERTFYNALTACREKLEAHTLLGAIKVAIDRGLLREGHA